MGSPMSLTGGLSPAHISALLIFHLNDKCLDSGRHTGLTSEASNPSGPLPPQRHSPGVTARVRTPLGAPAAPTLAHGC